MTHDFQTNHLIKSKAQRSAAFRITLLAGGTGQLAIPFHYFNLDSCEYLIVTDTQDELRKTEQIRSRIPHCRALQLGQRTTSDTLLLTRFPQTHEIFDHIGVANGHNGMAQRPALASIAARRVVSTKAWQRIQSELLDSAILLHNGLPDVFKLVSLSSLSGASGVAAAPEMIIALANHLAKSGSTVVIEYHCLDSIPFTGMGASVHSNSHAALANLVQTVVTRNRGSKASNIIFNVVYFSLPAGLDEVSRSRYLLVTQQAWLCPSLQRLLDTESPNYALANRFGNILVLSTGFFADLPQEEIAGFIARAYQEKIQSGLAEIEAVGNLVASIILNVVAIPRPCVSINDILEHLHEVSTVESIRAIERPAFIFTADPRVILNDRREIRLEGLHDSFAAPPKTLGLALDSLSVVRSLSRVLTDELEILQGDQEQDIAVLNSSRNRIGSSIEGYKHRRWFPKRYYKKIKRASEHLRKVAESVFRRQFTIELLSKALAKCSNEIESQTARMQRIIFFLDRNAMDDLGTVSTPLVEYRDIDDAFEKLLDAVYLPEELQRAAIASNVTTVTLHGLARIVGAESIAIEAILDCLVSPDSLKLECSPGGSKRDEDSAAYVLPPVGNQVLSLLQSELGKRDPRAVNRIFAASSASIGINIVRFGFSHPSSEEDIFTDIQKSAYAEALESPVGALCRVGVPDICKTSDTSGTFDQQKSDSSN